MPSDNLIIVAAAGGGKTTRIARHAAERTQHRIALVTYTLNNVSEIEAKLYKEKRYLPAHIEIWPWITFLLREMARPYRRAMYNHRIEGVQFIDGRSDRYANSADIARYYFNRETNYIYSDKLARFICEVDKVTDGAVMARLRERFDAIYIDEVQDLAGYDLDVVELMLRSGIRVMLVGDHRQATFKTNQSPRNKQYSGRAIINKLLEWQKSGLAELQFENDSHRCNPAIAAFASTMFPSDPAIISRNEAVTDHDGVFAVRSSQVNAYINRYVPQILRLTRKTDCQGHPALNFGIAKGMTFDRVLVFPHVGGTRWLKSGECRHIEGSLSEMYVGATRARHSLAYVYDGVLGLSGIQTYKGP